MLPQIVRTHLTCPFPFPSPPSFLNPCPQAQQALMAAQQAAANAPPKQVEGWVPTRLISDLFVAGAEAATPTGEHGWAC